MVTRDILHSHPITNLRKEISKTNIKGYSKMTKAQLVDVMMKNKERFGHIKAHTKTRKPRAKPAKPAKVPGFKSGERVKIKRKPKVPALTERKGEKKAVKVTQLNPKQKEKVKKIPASQLKKFTGLSKEQANKLDPLQLFGKLPAELRKTILQPKSTGVVVGKKDILNDEAILLVGQVLDTIAFGNSLVRDLENFGFYDGGNFGQVANDVFDKQAERLEKVNSSINIDFLKLLENEKFEKACVATHKQMNEEGEYVFKEMKRIEERIMDAGEDREYYYHDETYGLNLDDDGDFNTTNRTRSTVKAVTTKRINILKKSIKDELKPLIKLVKSGKAYV